MCEVLDRIEARGEARGIAIGEARGEARGIAIGEERGEARGIAIGEARGEAHGVERNAVQSIRNLMTTLKLSAHQAMDALMIPQNEQEHYLALLNS